MTRLSQWIAGLAGWRRALVAVLAGAFATMALPPFGLWPALFAALPVLLLLLEGAGSARRAFWAGFWWSYGYFVAGVYWIGIALLVDPERFAWLLPFASLGLPLVFALFPAVAGVLAVAVGRRGPGLLLALAGAWVLGEYARGHVLTGFPWNPLAVAWIEVPVAAQGASLLGAYGLGGVSVLVAGLPFLLLTRAPGRAVAAALAVAVAGGLLAYGALRLPAGPADRAEPALRLRLVQGNIDQRLKHSEAARAEHFNRHMDLSMQPAADGVRPRVVIWPETALPYTLDAAPQLPGILGAVAGDGGIALIGAVRIEEQGQSLRAWNSLHALSRDGTLAGTYDKHHLVPFGEYLPLRGVLGLFGLDKLAVGAVDFSAGPGPVSLDLPGLPAVLPLICYEAIFPEAAADPARRPAWLVNVTNDAWFGTSSGPPQHLAQARLRAIEQGLPLARAANTGISALVDPFGRVEQALPLGEAGIIDGDLPAALPPTVFSRLGTVATLASAVVFLLFGIFWRRLPS
ncbi:apolipoprotein N-acyltransferase [Zavarzinia compransoris]|uniref:Apolipoprotein N-acyltransferase n=1 Tax=Zavarzinia compransoris TaxID=1264899 RepID=A0A317E2P9_9PROT|nr:apolipoprotein N-acyltransferase [Zavarzinia compransoris]PWR20891.1 apolipoprotein N-acyltransferase [Zavarzinia compransoris]TDP44271.1 apolipoprotein N-acyltransferase [Zavarzinia compransoris]